MLRQHGEAQLHGPGCTLQCPGRANDLFPALAAEPLVLELYVRDKYAKDVATLNWFYHIRKFQFSKSASALLRLFLPFHAAVSVIIDAFVGTDLWRHPRGWRWG